MDLKSIDKIFEKRIFRIPSYQRGYSWKNNKKINPDKPDSNKNLKGNLVDLWNDIANIPDGKWHYTGVLTLVEMEKEYNWLRYDQYAIVDGQQRITSILILIKVILSFAEKLGIELGIREGDARFQYLEIVKGDLTSYIFGYDKDNPSDKYFRKHILEINEIEDESKESIYTENLKLAKEYFEYVVDKYIEEEGNSKQKRLQQLYDKVTGDLRLNEYILPEDLDQFVVFETMNNRGKPLSELEKLKNRLMYLSDKIVIKEKDEDYKQGLKKDVLKKINTAWITIYQELGADKNDPLPDEDFIKAHWIIYFPGYDKSEAKVYSSFLFKEYFTIECIYDGTLTVKKITSYVESLQKCSKVWNMIHHPDCFLKADQKIKEAIEGLHQVGFRASFKPLVLAALSERKEPIDSIIETIKLLEKLAFKVFNISNRRSNTGDTKLYRYADKIFDSIEKKENKEPLDLPSACDEIQLDVIDQYYSYDAFKSQIIDLFNIGDQSGYYGWSGLKYFLFNYDNSLRKGCTNNEASKIEWQDFKNSNSIEHIFPQSATKSLEDYCKDNNNSSKINEYENLKNNWLEFFHYEPRERNRLCNSLGNLLAISRADNSSLSNDPFIYKKDQSAKGDEYLRRGYKYDSMSARIVADEDNWTPETIKRRGLEMLDYLLDLIGEKKRLTIDDKLELLGLSFMSEKKLTEYMR